MKCQVLPERVVYLGRSRVRHVMPMCHVQVITREEAREEMREQTFLREFWNPAYDNRAYGAFRIDFGRRVLRDLTYEQAADYLEANQATWPAYDFTAEIRYWRARARGERVCEACGEVLPPAPPCSCGCQGPPKPVAGFSLVGDVDWSKAEPIGTGATGDDSASTRSSGPSQASVRPGAPQGPLERSSPGGHDGA